MRTIILLTLMLVAVIFAVQNADVVAIDVLFWKVNASLAIVIALCVTAGVIVGLLISLPRIYRMRTDHRRLRAQLAELNDPVTSQTSEPNLRSPPPPASLWSRIVRPLRTGRDAT